DAGRYADYLDGLAGVFGAVRRALKPGGYAVVTAENVRLADGSFLPLAWDVARVLGRRFTLCEERVLLYRRAAPGDADPGRTSRAREYALVGRNAWAEVDVGEALALLRGLAAAGVEFVVIGSLARRLHGDAARPADVDLLLPDDAGMLTRAVRFLTGQGFQ